MKHPSEHFAPVITSRFVVRPLREDDVSDRYLSWFQDETTRSYIKAADSPQTLDSLRAFVRAKRISPSALLLGIFAHDLHVHVGNLKFEPIDTRLGTAVVGVLIGDPAWRNKGVFREVFHAAAEKLFAVLELRSFWLGVAADNSAAVEAYRKAGFGAQDRPPPELIPDIHPGAIYMQYRVSR